MKKPKMPKAQPGDREFWISIIVRETEDSVVSVHEIGAGNVTTALVPKGRFGVTEAIRVARKLVTEFYDNRQRELILHERAKQVDERRQQRFAERLAAEREKKLAAIAPPAKPSQPEEPLPVYEWTLAEGEPVKASPDAPDAARTPPDEPITVEASINGVVDENLSQTLTRSIQQAREAAK